MRIAYELGRPEHEIEAMPLDEFARWSAFFKIMWEKKQKPSQH